MSLRTAIRRVGTSTYGVRTFTSSTPISFPRRTTNQFSPFYQPDTGSYESTTNSPATASSSSSKPPPSSTSDSPSISKGRTASLPEQTFEDADYDTATALESARRNAWYLDDPSEEIIDPDLPIRRQPHFVTYDPERTTPQIDKFEVESIPHYAPEELKKLHGWMTSEDAAFVLDTSSVRFLHTGRASRENLGSGDVIDVYGGEVEAQWKWIVVALAKGRGKGIVGRAERALRIWLHKNPLVDTSKQYGKSNKLPRTPDWTDWSMVQIPELSTSINIFTAEGRDRWDLEEMWAEQDPNLSISGKRRRPFGMRRTGWAD